ncbi:kinesin family protein [Ceratobasidium sp. AG-Ba]|nr:kinesin family protein [Ceratobasidium sp. AG-Ba]QRW12182.1 kinesin family protein [Ceratobasidium sp. AG-Ba]
MADTAVDDRAAKAARAKALLKSRQKKKAGATPGSSGTPVGLSSLRHSTVASPSQDGSVLSYAPSETGDDNKSEASANVAEQSPVAVKPQPNVVMSPSEAPIPTSRPSSSANNHGDISSLFSPSQPATGFRSASSLFGGDDGPAFSPGPSPGEIALSQSELERTRIELQEARAQLQDVESRLESAKAAAKTAEQASRRANEAAMIAEEGAKRTAEELRKANALIEEIREDQHVAREDATASYEAMRATEAAKRQAEEELGNVRKELTQALETLTRERTTAAQEVEAMRSELEAANSLSAQRQSTISLLVEEKSNLSSQLTYLEDLEARSQEVNRTLEDAQVLNEKLNARVNELETSLRAATSTSEELTVKEREASDRVRELERLSTHSTRTIADLQAELKDQRARVRELEEQIEADDRVDVLERNLKSMQDRSEELEEKFNKSKQLVVKLKTERDSFEARYNEAETTIREWQRRHGELESECESLRSEYSALKTAHGALESAQRGLNARLEGLEKQLEQAANDAKDADTTHSNIKQQLNEALALAARGASTEAALTALQAENEGLLANLAEMRPKIVELTETKLTLGETIEARNASIREYESQINTLETELASAHSRIDEFSGQSGAAASRVSDLEGQLQKEKLALSEAYAAYEELQARFKLVEQQSKEAESVCNDLRSRREESETRAARIDADLERRTREVTSLLEEIESRNKEVSELRAFLERSRADIEAANNEITAREDELARLRVNGAKSPAHDPATLAGETMELELSTMRSRVRTLEAEAFDAHAREHALHRQVAELQNQIQRLDSRAGSGLGVGHDGGSGTPDKRHGSYRTSGELGNTRSGVGSARATTLIGTSRTIRLSALDASLPPETRNKRAVSLNMLRARIISEMDSGASGVSPNIRLTSNGEDHTATLHNHENGVNLMGGGEDEAHVFWCSACEGELVVL